MPWSTPLSWSITSRNGAELRTLRDAAEMIATLPPDRQKHDWVTYAAGLLLQARKTADKDDIEDATRQVERALKREGML